MSGSRSPDAPRGPCPGTHGFRHCGRQPSGAQAETVGAELATALNLAERGRVRDLEDPEVTSVHQRAVGRDACPPSRRGQPPAHLATPTFGAGEGAMSDPQRFRRLRSFLAPTISSRSATQGPGGWGPGETG